MIHTKKVMNNVITVMKEFVVSPSILIIIKGVGLRSTRVNYKEENSSLCRDYLLYLLDIYYHDLSSFYKAR